MEIEFGDGGINNPWQLVVYLNSEADREYSYYVSSLITSLFDIQVVIGKRPVGKRLTLVSSSTSVIEFIVSKEL